MRSRKEWPSGPALDRAVTTLCPLVQERLSSQQRRGWCEYDLRKELVGCILASRVRSSSAVSATARIEAAALLDGSWWYLRDKVDYEAKVQRVLAAEEDTRSWDSAYRFHRTKARALAGARATLLAHPVHTLLTSNQTPYEVRTTLVQSIPGLGPKQASMFLRNVGYTDTLAVLDVHILRFMSLSRLYDGSPSGIANLTGYLQVEAILRRYALNLGVQVGVLDWAIWIVMLAASRSSL